MAQGSHGKVKVKNTNIKQIFQTMEYGQMAENTSSAQAWLKEKQKGSLYAYIDNKEVGSKGKTTELKDVNNGEPLVKVYSPQADDVHKIILKSAQNDKWAAFEGTDRAIILDRLAKEIEKNTGLFCELEVAARGILSSDTKTKALPLLIDYLQYYSSFAIRNQENRKGQAITVSVISDESFLAVFGFVLGPALAAGYNVIFQTEPRISLAAFLIVELAEKIGIPEGTIKLLPGIINLDSIFHDENVIVVSSFGNLHAQKYDNVEIPTYKKFLAVTNSKIPMIVFNNGDLDSACESLVDAAWGYQGLLPWSVNTLLVQEDIFEAFVEKLKYRLSKVKMSSASDKMADVSYPISVDAAKKLGQAVHDAKLQGIEVFQSNQNCETFQPTLLIGGKLFNNNVILEDECLPIVTVLAFRTSNEAVSLANNSRFGFGAMLWTENIGLANEVMLKLNVGSVWVNSHAIFSATSTINPRKQSGIGYFGGTEGFSEYIQNTKMSMVSSYLKDQAISKDPYAVIVAAKKAQEIWNKMTSLTRSQLWTKVASELNAAKEHLSKNSRISESMLKSWISAIYEGTSYVNDLGSVSVQKCYELRSYKEAVGVIFVEGMSISTIVRALLLGNAVIIFNPDETMLKFVAEISKILSNCKVPPGILSIISHGDLLNIVTLDNELTVVLRNNYDSRQNIKVRDLKRFYVSNSEWADIFSATNVKNVWSTIGNSIL